MSSTYGKGKLPYPNTTDAPDGPGGFLALDTRLDYIGAGVCVTATAATRAAIVTAGDAYQGLLCLELDTYTMWLYTGSAWQLYNLNDSGWTTATLQNSWVAYGAPYATPQYRLLNGWVGVEGGIKSGTVTAGTLLFTLPVGMRPLNSLVFPVLSGSTSAYVVVASNGNVSALTTLTSSSVLLDPIRFIAEQ